MSGRLFATLVGVPSVVTAWWYRPIANHNLDVKGPFREGWPWMSKENLHDEAHESPPLGLSVARSVLTPVVVIFWRLVLNYSHLGGDFILKKDENYEHFLASMTRRHANQAIITVANHRSLLDDPLIMCNLLPWHLGIQPRYLRWNTCAQEYCFNGNLPSLINAFFGTGQSLPVWRGGGINQRPWLDFARHVANGDWCHVFPEAGIWQKEDGSLGGRGSQLGSDASQRSSDTPDDAGKLKWGIGKLIAHAPITPIVIPFHHMGMEEMLEQNAETRRLHRPVWEARSLRKGIHVLFGEPIDFSDILEEHERREGPLIKFSASSKADSMHYLLRKQNVAELTANATEDKDTDTTNEEQEEGVDFHKYWDSSPAELKLYHKITLRIEQRMRELNDRRRHSKEVIS